MKLELLKLSDLHLDPENARKHDKKNIAAIKASLSKFNQVKPIVVDKDNIVRAGNGMLMAAKELGWEKIAVVRTELTGAALKGYAVADNRIAELSDWDSEVLFETLKELCEGDEVDLKDIGFTEKEFASLLASLQGPESPGGLPSAPPIPQGEPTMPPVPAADQVRIVQLYLKPEEFDSFQAMIDQISDHFKKDNVTDAVIAGLNSCVQNLKESPA